MIKPNELFEAIKKAEAVPAKPVAAAFKILSLLERGLSLNSPPPAPEADSPRGRFNAYLDALSTEAIRDLYALMYSGRGDGSFIECYRDAQDRTRGSMLDSIKGKAPSVVAMYWRQAIKQPG